MKWTSTMIVAVAGVLVLALVLGVRAGMMPLGVRGEWEWLRVPFAPAAIEVAIAMGGVLAYAGFCGWGMQFLEERATRGRTCLCLVGLGFASVGVQVAVQSGAPYGYGLAKWVIALHQRGSSGYFAVAKEEAGEPLRFLGAYPEWIQRQDALHLGTHPPGLIVLDALVLHGMERNPEKARWIVGMVPGTVADAFRAYGATNRLSMADRATLATLGMLTLLACGLTVWPLYALARAWLPAPEAWATAALWPLVPSAILFQPTADTAFPLGAATALALAAWGGADWVRFVAGVACGVVLGVGMEFSLVFLPVGLLVAVVVAGERGVRWQGKLVGIGATGLGFLGMTLLVWGLGGMNPFAVWWWNQRNHSRFYVEFPRSYGAWVVANPIEMAVAIGVPVAVWGLATLGWPKGVPRVGVATAGLLVFLTLGGRNLSEVARIWLPFMPGLLVVAGYAMRKVGVGPKGVAATIVLMGVESLALEAMIQVVYPV